MQAPKLIRGCVLSETTTLFVFDEQVVCFGDPHKGPWVELNNGYTRRFEVGEQIVGGYAWMAQRVNRADFSKPPTDSLESLAYSFQLWYMCHEILERGQIHWEAKYA